MNTQYKDSIIGVRTLGSG